MERLPANKQSFDATLRQLANEYSSGEILYIGGEFCSKFEVTFSPEELAEAKRATRRVLRDHFNTLLDKGGDVVFAAAVGDGPVSSRKLAKTYKGIAKLNELRSQRHEPIPHRKVVRRITQALRPETPHALVQAGAAETETELDISFLNLSSSGASNRSETGDEIGARSRRESGALSREALSREALGLSREESGDGVKSPASSRGRSGGPLNRQRRQSALGKRVSSPPPAEPMREERDRRLDNDLRGQPEKRDAQDINRSATQSGATSPTGYRSPLRSLSRSPPTSPKLGRKSKQENARPINLIDREAQAIFSHFAENWNFDDAQNPVDLFAKMMGMNRDAGDPDLIWFQKTCIRPDRMDRNWKALLVETARDYLTFVHMKTLLVGQHPDLQQIPDLNRILVSHSANKSAWKHPAYELLVSQLASVWTSDAQNHAEKTSELRTAILTLCEDFKKK